MAWKIASVGIRFHNWAGIMAYKDPQRQREAVRLAVRRHRLKHKGITPISNNVIPCVIPTLKRISQPGVGDNDGFYEVEAPEPQSHNSMMVGYVPKTE